MVLALPSSESCRGARPSRGAAEPRALEKENQLVNQAGTITCVR